MPDLLIETDLGRTHGGRVAGIDEVGRGPWAGPVFAAAVIIDAARMPPALMAMIDDSKRIPRGRRERIALEIRRHAAVGLGSATVAEIDEMNVLNASMLAMRRAFAALPEMPAAVLVDGNRLPELPCPARAVVGGDGHCLGIAAASIVAKVARDALMSELAYQYDVYGWERNAGYGTAEHRRGLERYGPTPEHRRSFSAVRKLLNPEDS